MTKDGIQRAILQIWARRGQGVEGDLMALAQIADFAYQLTQVTTEPAEPVITPGTHEVPQDFGPYGPLLGNFAKDQ